MRNIRNLIDEARGERNMVQFAKDCGRSPAWMYNLYKGEVARVPNENFLKRFIDAADKNANITIDELQDAIEEGIKPYVELQTEIDKIKKETETYSSYMEQRQKNLKLDFWELEKTYFDEICGILFDAGFSLKQSKKASSDHSDFSVTISDDSTTQQLVFDVTTDYSVQKGSISQSVYAKIGRWMFNKTDYPENTRFYVVVAKNELRKMHLQQYQKLENKLSENISLLVHDMDVTKSGFYEISLGNPENRLYKFKPEK